jgi:hypothetical protein
MCLPATVTRHHFSALTPLFLSKGRFPITPCLEFCYNSKKRLYNESTYCSIINFLVKIGNVALRCLATVKAYVTKRHRNCLKLNTD